MSPRIDYDRFPRAQGNHLLLYSPLLSSTLLNSLQQTHTRPWPTTQTWREKGEEFRIRCNSNPRPKMINPRASFPTTACLIAHKTPVKGAHHPAPRRAGPPERTESGKKSSRSEELGSRIQDRSVRMFEPPRTAGEERRDTRGGIQKAKAEAAAAML